MVLAAVILVITRLSTGTMNPLAVFRGGESLLLKFVVGFFLLVMGLNLLNLLFGQGGGHVLVCAGCREPLIGSAAVRGPPLRCPICRRLFHKRCFQATGGTLRGGCRREPCPSASFASPETEQDATT